MADEVEKEKQPDYHPEEPSSPRGKMGKKGNLYFHVIEARNLLGKDAGGVSDPYVNVYLDNKKIQKTQIMLKTVQPKWKEKAPLVEMKEDDTFKELAFRLWDYDRFKWDEFLGEARVQLSDLYDRVPRNEWLKLCPRKGKKEKVEGELHVQLLFLAEDDTVSDSLDEFRWPLNMLQKQGKREPFFTLVARSDNLEVADGDGEYPTHVACTLNEPEFLIKLLEKGANAKAQNEKDQSQPAHRAAVHSVACLKILKEKGVNLSAPDEKGNTPLHAAALADNRETILYLIQNGVSPNVQNQAGDTPLHVALQNKKNREAIRALIENNADIFLENKEKVAPSKLVFNKKVVTEFNKTAFVDSLDIATAHELEPRRTLKHRHCFDGDGVNFDWKESFQYALTFKNAAKACTLLHVPFDVAKGADPAELLGYIVIKTPEPKHREPSYQTELVGYGKGSNPMFFDVDPQFHYAIVPHALVQESAGMKFKFITYADGEISHNAMVPYKEQVTVKGMWKKDESAGGCKTEETFGKNPKYLLTFPKGEEKLECIVMLTQARGTMDAIYKNTIRVVTHDFYIGYVFMDGKGKEILDENNEHPELVIKYKNCTDNYKHFVLDTTERNQFVIVPTTFKPNQETIFEMTVFSDVKATLEPFQ